MRPIGYSTGSLALGDFTRALAMLEGTGVEVIELSALRVEELPALVEAAPSLPLGGYRHVSVHAPSKFPVAEEDWVIRQLGRLAAHGWPIILHPDAIHSFDAWRGFGRALWIENMDKRKPIGRSAIELDSIFDRLPEAGLCLDLAHARQFDPSMVEAYRILLRHGSRLRQVHLSEVGSTSRHTRLSFAAIHDFREVARWIPHDVPIILESPVLPTEIASEIQRAHEALESPVLVRI